MASRFEQGMSLLGKRVRDKVTKLEGVVTSVSFDLYGCVMAIINPGVGIDGKMLDREWFDVHRLEVIDPTPVMDVPRFAEQPTTKATGPESKPAQ